MLVNTSSNKLIKLIHRYFLNISDDKISLFFDSKKFLIFYKNLLKILIYENFNKDNIFLVQKRPSLRIFLPKQRGTSFHTDYWYGHGKDTYTFWIPIRGLKKGNCVYFAKHTNNFNFANNLVLQMLKKKITIDAFNKKLLKKSSEEIANGGYLLFDSKIVHGSPLNTSNSTRISFDFRITKYGKDYGSKDISNNFIFRKGVLTDPILEFSNKKYLKYVVGGKFSTQSQHIFINAFAKEKKLIISEQDAEMERFDFPILRRYLSNFDKKRFEGIVIYSKKSVKKEIYINIIKGLYDPYKIIFASENEYFPIKII